MFFHQNYIPALISVCPSPSMCSLPKGRTSVWCSVENEKGERFENGAQKMYSLVNSAVRMCLVVCAILAIWPSHLLLHGGKHRHCVCFLRNQTVRIVECQFLKLSTDPWTFRLLQGIFVERTTLCLLFTVWSCPVLYMRCQPWWKQIKCGILSLLGAGSVFPEQIYLSLKFFPLLCTFPHVHSNGFGSLPQGICWHL